MAIKLGGLAWIGRIAVAIFVGAVLLNTLSANSRYQDEPLMLYGLPLIAAILCMLILYLLTKS
jgi:hypothetical protein